MSTHAFIAKKIGTDKYKAIYCQFDGYLSHVGKMLAEHYDTTEKVDALLSLGGIQSLGEQIGPAPEGLENREDEKYTVAFKRDLDDDFWNTEEMTLDELLNNGIDECYVYIFGGDERWIYSGFSDLEDGFRDVKRALQFLVSEEDPYDLPIAESCEKETILKL